ncbi:leishmanolysin-related zinc metalloendopeptidase [Alteromonas sp. D210916BOD_24]|uniref:leishmanolysin-related zinc metalloendopeptidase n=1 Tax=Alteromonas sp. D210916BOD_24 TaxID=3157618 RepID=UPI00399C987C
MLLAIIALAITTKAHAGTFSINITSTASIDPSVSPLFEQAIDFWESALIGTQDNIDVILNIDASTPAIDGVGNTLGQATNTTGVIASRFLYAIEGLMRFDIADIGRFSQSTKLDIILHEMAHVIGFGTLWNTNQFSLSGLQNVYISGTGEYTGSYALQLYRELFDSNATFVPVELDGGAGTANAHWDEGFINNTGELLTGFLDANTFVSDISLASFADIGYVVRLSDGRILGLVVPAPSFNTLFALVFFLYVVKRPFKKRRIQ